MNRLTQVSMIVFLSFVAVYFLGCLWSKRDFENFIACNKLIDSIEIDVPTIKNSPFYEKTLSEMKSELADTHFNSLSSMLSFMNKTIVDPPFYENVYQIKRKNRTEAVFYREGMPYGFHVTHSPVHVHGILFSDKIHALMNSEPNPSKFWSDKNYVFI